MFIKKTGLLSLSILLAIFALNISATEVPSSIITLKVKTKGIAVLFDKNSIETAFFLANKTGYTIQTLIEKSEDVQKFRKNVDSKQLDGRITVKFLQSEVLPYTENFINLLVITDYDELLKKAIGIDEVLRVTAPYGRCCLKGSADIVEKLADELKKLPVYDVVRKGEWIGFSKKYPEKMAEWTHGRCNGDGNIVSQDKLVGLLRHTQWVAGPRFQRSHGMLPSYTVMVSAKGRLFYIADDSVAGYSGLPDKWTLTAHDAFNGMTLWKRPVPEWGWQAWSYWGEGHASRYNLSIQILKRMVVENDRLYITLGFNAPVSEIDAATGKILRVFENTKYTDEIVCRNGVLYLSVCDEKQKPWPGKGVSPFPTSRPEYKKRVMALDLKTGKTLWQTEQYIGRGVKADRLGAYKRLDVIASDKAVYFMDIKAIHSLDPKTGKERWSVPRKTPYTEYVFKNKSKNKYAPWKVLQDATKERQNLVAYRDTLLVSEAGKSGVLYYALDAASGKELWKYSGDTPFKSSYINMYPIGDTVWVLSSKLHDVVGLDLKTGKEVKTYDFKDISGIHHHHRCYPDKATVRYLVFAQAGAEFMDLSNGEVWEHNWQRSGCRFGYVFANGLTYKTPDHCFCYANARLQGFYTMASPEEAYGFSKCISETHPLEKGPAYNTPIEKKEEKDGWPTFRHDIRRSGSTNTPVSAKLKELWNAKIAEIPTAPTLADGKLFFCGKDSGNVYARNAENGKEIWRFLADAPIESPPTFYEGKIVFGCHDGWVYCLNASDGVLRWRFRAAPGERMISSYNNIESVWPVPGSVLVAEGKVFCTAGRSSYLDEGITECVIDVETGELIEKYVSKDVMKVDFSSGRGYADPIPGTLSDIPVSDGKDIYMRFTKFKVNTALSQQRYPDHLKVDGGFLDDRIFQKAKWIYAGINANNIVFDSKNIYAAPIYSQYTNRGHYIPKGGATDYLGFPQKASEVAKVGGYTVLAAQQPKLTERDRVAMAVSNEKKASSHGKSTLGKKKKKSKKPPKAKMLWKQDGNIPVSPWSMALAPSAETPRKKIIFIAGFQDEIDPEDPWAMIEGRRGGDLLLLNASDGKIIRKYKLSSAPVWNGMALAYGKVYITCRDGHILCLGTE